MTRDDAKFLSAAEGAAHALLNRSRNAFYAQQPVVSMSYDEFTEIALAFARAVQLGVDAHLEQATGRRA